MDEPQSPDRSAAFWQSLLSQGSDAISRRDFAQLLGASIALAGQACSIGPSPGEILPPATAWADSKPGLPARYATTLWQHGYGVGVLATTREGRAIKIEGNPLHPASLGAAGIAQQASVLQLYDPDRLRTVQGPQGAATWEMWLASARGALGSGGEGCAILLEPQCSPHALDLLDRLQVRYPQLRLYSHVPLAPNAHFAAAQMLFGEPLEPVFAMESARTVVALDCDFLGDAHMALAHAREIARGRQGARAHAREGETHRLFCVESALTLTGAHADARLAVRPYRVGLLARHLLWLLAPSLDMPTLPQASEPPPLTPEETSFVGNIVAQVRRTRGALVVIAGPGQPPLVHAIAAVLNTWRGGAAAVAWRKPLLTDAMRGAGLAELTATLAAGAVRALFVLGGNPVYTAPSDVLFAEHLKRVAHRTYFGLHPNATAAACMWQLPAHHTLESWGDAQAYDGTASIVQPVMQPLYDGLALPDVLGALLNEPGATRGRAALQAFWQRRGVDAAAFEQGLAHGVLQVRASTLKPTLRWDAFLKAWTAAPARDPEGYTLSFRRDFKVQDGALANNAWLQELADPITKLTWGNAASLSPRSGEALGVQTQDRIGITLGERQLEIPVVIVPGHPDDTLTLPLGYGRNDGERVAAGVGVSVYALQTSAKPHHAAGAEIRKLIGPPAQLAFGQAPESWAGRPVQQADKVVKAPPLSFRGEVAMTGPQWGMTIDLDRCTGCQACVIACQAENNIPVVGRENVRKGRAMHWLRIDRYFAAAGPPLTLQPMLCQHCEHAPCEYVCPVGATQHSPDGLNEMVYNRCVGTRFCSNNCPYKVRRFNWFYFHNDAEPVAQMVYNPEVSVRARGVMEKCTFCVQRIRAAQHTARQQAAPLPDNAVATACQQTCPTQAITFGDINRPDSAARHAFDDPRAVVMLAELGTRPRVRYLQRRERNVPG